MAREVAHYKDGLIIELGPGTGVVTKALLKQGVAPERLLVVEYSNRFVQRLRKQFPHVTIVHGNAADLCQIVPKGVKVSAIVSSLPLCSLPEAVTQSIVQQWQRLLHDSGIISEERREGKECVSTGRTRLSRARSIKTATNNKQHK